MEPSMKLHVNTAPVGEGHILIVSRTSGRSTMMSLTTSQDMTVQTVCTMTPRFNALTVSCHDLTEEQD